jgi:hypothetical protein
VTTDAWITLVVLILTFGVLAFDRLPTAAAMGAAVGVLLLVDVVDQARPCRACRRRRRSRSPRSTCSPGRRR